MKLKSFKTKEQIYSEKSVKREEKKKSQFKVP